VQSSLWIGLAVVVVAFAGGIAFVVFRGLAAYRMLRSVGSELTAAVDRVLTRADAVAGKAERLAPGSERLTGALERLRVSRARLNVLLEAIAQVRAGIARVTGVVPRKS
jgi:hypothetical protein